MTEDDTFRVLKRKPESYDAALLYMLGLSANRIDNAEKCNKELMKFGWTLDEFNNEYFRRQDESIS